jgi:hypothetical protein
LEGIMDRIILSRQMALWSAYQYFEEVLIRISYIKTVDHFELLIPWNFKW